MTKAEVEQLSRDAMNIPGGQIMRRGTNQTAQNDEVSEDEVDKDDNPEEESHENHLNYCPNCGANLRTK